MQDSVLVPLEYGAVALIAVVTAAVWFLGKTGDPNTRDSFGQVIKPPKPTRRDELIKARDRVRRQIEILQTPMRSGDYTQMSRQNIERLQAVLEGIEAELKDQKP
jgi:hypothetical protein